MATTRKIVRQGVVFFVLQLTAAVTFFSDSLILSALVGPEAVPTIAVPARLFSYVSLGVGVLLTPLWPAYAEALSRGDHSWVKAALRKSLWFALGISVVGSLFLNLFADLIFHTWVGPEYAVDRRIIAALGFWTVIESVGMAVAMFLNGASILRPQLVIAPVLLVTSLVLRIVLLKNIGVLGLPLATIAAYLVTTLIPYAILLPGLVRGVTSTYDAK
jgi:O-antigen/teichoic acid export membrane protein